MVITYQLSGPTKNPLALSIFLRFELRDLSYLSIVFNTGYMCMGIMQMQDHGYLVRGEPRTSALLDRRPSPLG